MNNTTTKHSEVTMSNNKQSSSIDFYRSCIIKITADGVSKRITGEQWDLLERKAFEQAKAMEKKQCVDFALKCMLNGLKPHQSTREVVEKLFDEGLQ